MEHTETLLAAALSGLLNQAEQMRRVFDDEDGEIATAINAAEEALEIWNSAPNPPDKVWVFYVDSDAPTVVHFFSEEEANAWALAWCHRNKAYTGDKTEAHWTAAYEAMLPQTEDWLTSYAIDLGSAPSEDPALQAAIDADHHEEISRQLSVANAVSLTECEGIAKAEAKLREAG